MLLEKIADWLERRGLYKVVYRDHGTYNKPYLKRFYLFRTKWLGIFIHQFFDSDEMIGLHDHPWPNISWVRRCGYIEHLPDGSAKWRSPGFFCFRMPEQFHRIELLRGTEGKVWTIFIRFRRCRRWGFMINGKWTDARKVDPTANSKDV
jgi:hypothetical protein